MTTERRKAPRRKIKNITRVGTWGTVKYHHHLDCGHIEVRQRASTAPKLACAWCLRVGNIEEELLALNAGPVDNFDENVDENVVEQLDAEAKVRAEISKRLGLPLESIDVTINELNSHRVATIFLSRSDVSKMTGQQ